MGKPMEEEANGLMDILCEGPMGDARLSESENLEAEELIRKELVRVSGRDEIARLNAALRVGPAPAAGERHAGSSLPVPRCGDRDQGADVKQIGPTIKIKRSCQECVYCRSERYQVQGDSGSDVTCQHPHLAGEPGDRRRYIGDTTWSTPTWCPVLSLAPSPAPASPAAEGAPDLVHLWPGAGFPCRAACGVELIALHEGPSFTTNPGFVTCPGCAAAPSTHEEKE